MLDPLGSGVRGGCEPPEVVSGNQTSLLQKQYLFYGAELSLLPLKLVSSFSDLVILGCNNVIITKFQWLTAGSQ